MDYFTSDWHIAHKNILKFCDRGVENLDEMHHKLITEHNNIISDYDTCYFLGDMAFNIGIGTEVISQLNGHRILVRGNHDFKSSTMSRMGFHFVCERLDLKRMGKDLTLCHFPFKPSKFKHINVPVWKKVLFGAEDTLRYINKRPIDRGQWILHGHTHDKDQIKGRMIHVGVDAWDMKPVSLRQVESLISKGDK